jgi:FkbM family methyltransferase
MSFSSYSQNFEDVILRRALKDVDKGSYVDLGAQDPVYDSVSLTFYELGWRGVHVEATPAYASRLREARPDEVVIEAAVSSVEGLIQFHEIPETGLSTGREDIAEEHRKSGWASTIITVPTVRLEHVLQLIDGPIHWLKIDVEGMEGAALESWGDSEVRPWILVIEATYPNSPRPTHDDWSNEVEKRGYEEVYFDGLSRFYLHRDQGQLRDAFAAAPNVFDGFQLSDRHFSTNGLTHRYAEELGRRDQAFAGLSEAQQRGQVEIDALKAEVELRGEALREAIERETQARATVLDYEERVRRLDETQQRLSELGDSHASLTHQLVAAEKEHWKNIEASWQDRRGSEDALRSALQLREDALAQALRHAEASAAAAQIELAKATERTLHLEQRAKRAGEEAQEMKRAREEAQEIQRQLGDANARADLVEQELRRQLVDAQTRVDRIEQDKLLQVAEAGARADKLEQELRLKLSDAFAWGQSLEEELQLELVNANARAADLERELKQQLADAQARADRLENDKLLQVAEASARADSLGQEMQRQLADAFAWGHSLEEELRQLADASAAAENNEKRLKSELADAFSWGHALEKEMQWRLAEAGARADLLYQDMVRQLAELDLEFDALAACQDRADRLIKGVLAEPPPRWRRLGFALGLERLSPAHRALSDWSLPITPATEKRAAQPPINDNGTEIPMLPQTTPVGRNPYLRADSLTELLSWHDVNFVRCAFVTVLGRQPDPDGEAFYTDLIRRGRLKMEVLRQLRRSNEGRNHDPGIAALDRELRKHRNATRPFVGWIFRAISAREGDTKRERQFRVIENSVRTIAELVGVTQRKTLRIEEFLGSSQSELNGHLRNVIAAISRVDEKIGHNESSQRELRGQLQDATAAIGDVGGKIEHMQSLYNDLRQQLHDVLATESNVTGGVGGRAGFVTIEHVLEAFVNPAHA